MYRKLRNRLRDFLWWLRDGFDNRVTTVYCDCGTSYEHELWHVPGRRLCIYASRCPNCRRRYMVITYGRNSMVRPVDEITRYVEEYTTGTYNLLDDGKDVV